jgi:hypothetical protein
MILKSSPEMLWNRLGRKSDRHGERRPDHPCDRSDIANEIEIEPVVEGCVGRIV